MKKIEVVVGERFYIRGDKIFQHFNFNKKYDKYLKNTMLEVYEQFEIKIKQHSLPFYFIKRRDDKPGKVVLEYESPNKDKPKNIYFTLFSFIPNQFGCDFCEYKRNATKPFIWCEYKQKTLPYKLKKCKFFKQKREI